MLLLTTGVSRKPQYKDVCKTTIETLQRAHIFKVNCCLKVHNAHLRVYQHRASAAAANAGQW